MKSSILNKIYILAAIALLIFTSLNLNGCAGKETKTRPNILFIMVDDMGTEVAGCYGGKSYKTPNIDALAESGLKFTQCYSAPVCSPSRVKLLTGRYGFRTGQVWGHIPPDEITFGHILKDAGYKTAIAGKWQMTLLKNDPNHVKKMGFDQSCVFGWHEGPRYYQPLIYENGKILDNVKDKYGPDVYCDFLIDFIKRNKNNHFIAYYPMALAHDVTDDLDGPPPFGPKGRYETYKENIEYADKYIGKIVKVLDDLNVRDKTLILLTADNGTPKKYIVKYENGDYVREPVFSAIGDTVIQGGKSELTNGGTHVPLIANWQGVTPVGQNDVLIDFSDFLATFAELTGAQVPKDRKIDSRSFAPQLFGEKGNPRKWAYQEWKGRAWIRTKDWKLYDNGDLFDMRNDPYEKHVIKAENDSEESKKIREYLSGEYQKLKDSANTQ